jgi:hypothetical protein
MSEKLLPVISGTAVDFGADMASICMARMSSINRLNSIPWLMVSLFGDPHFFDTHSAGNEVLATRVPAFPALHL